MENFNAIITSWIAIIISVIALGLQLWFKYPRYRVSSDDASPNLAFVYQPHPGQLTYFNVKKIELEDDGIPTKARIIVYVQLSNHSETPITITKAELYDDKGEFVARTNHRTTGVNYYIDMMPYGNASLPFTMDLRHEQLKLPVSLPPYGVKYGYLLFPANEASEFNGSIKLYSPIGVKTYSVRVISSKTYKEQRFKHLPKVKRHC